MNLSIPLINIWVTEFGIDCIGKGEFNTFVIPINCLPNQLISYEENSAFKQEVCFYSLKDFWNFNISLRGRDGNILDNGNTDWVLVLEMVI